MFFVPTTADQVKPVENNEIDSLLDDDDELLIEEISIDGMCGVY